MPFSAVSAQDFINRERELAFLNKLIQAADRSWPANVLLKGGRGLGKSELLKQLYSSLFWEHDQIIPFYYSFRRGTLRSNLFARDYFTTFSRQYLAAVKKDPSFAIVLTTPLQKLYPAMASAGLSWMISLCENFEELMNIDNPCDLVLGAISAPRTAATEHGTRVVLLLDDFPTARDLHMEVRGDNPELVSFFGESLKAGDCFHILSGVHEELDSVFADGALRGKAQTMSLGPLAADAVQQLFSCWCEKNGIQPVEDGFSMLSRDLEGNPLYVRNLVMALRKMERTSSTLRDVLECYRFEVTEGETVQYWDSVLREIMPDRGDIRNALKLLTHLIDLTRDLYEPERLSRITGLSAAQIGSLLGKLSVAGIVTETGVIRDKVLRDVLRNLQLRIGEGFSPERIRSKMDSIRPDTSSVFEITLPLTSDSELVIAKAFEQIGRNLSLDEALTKQVQLALIESSINAIEHSGSRDNRLNARITADQHRLEIVIETSGKFFELGEIKEASAEEKMHTDRKRGWGLMLLRKIMDEVKVQRMGEKTRIVLVKNLPSGATK